MEQKQFESYAGTERIIPVVTLNDATYAVQLAWTLREAGFRTIEVTLRTPDSLRAIQNIASSDCDITVGAGSITNSQAVEDAIAAGAEFLVSPGLTRNLVEQVHKREIAFLPGVSTPSDIMLGMELGITLLKFFPAEPLGGVPYLKALSAPFPEARFVPTGGIRPQNLADYLDLPAVVACGGSWLAPAKAIASGDMSQVKSLCLEAQKLLGR
ncbi:MAG: bifunctional 4-hydroxy-2-oxoglutarate aldolase/2-dehydro-3-deoxy-phosphogluconate aldolase [Spirochaetaceae bacterium]|nr:MAG: bifunctional 4-hydroxy-2-oxoglutarate aldolase/2-dehydro-3-deoxy-phosphogluconate aldolase [Spirochaetaceae bacterium]